MVLNLFTLKGGLMQGWTPVDLVDGTGLTRRLNLNSD